MPEIYHLLLQTLIWGIVIGIIHFIIVGIFYTNPFISKIYQTQQKESPGVKKWDNKKAYILKMFLGTQIEIFILSFSYLFLKEKFTEANGFFTALILATIFTGIRVYPRFWNMWIQSTYPNKLLVIEFINGVIGTFVVVVGLYLLPVNTI